MSNLTALFSAFLISVGLVPLVKRLAFRTGRISQPRHDRWSQKPTPLLGGIAIYVAFIVALLVTWPVSELPFNLIAGASLAFIVGLLDDFRNLNPAAKMVGILLSASLMVFGGYMTAFFSSQLANVIVTLIWIAGLANAFNLLDNMDGLSAGTATVATLFLAFFFFRSGNEFLLVASLALAGASLGFLIFNFPPASIYMGDGGSIFIGTLLATISIAREPQASNVFAVIAVPAMLFMLPILDTALVSITRVMRGQSPALGGRDHTSHRLLFLGLTERQTLLVMLGISIITGIAAVLVEELSYRLSLFLIPLLVIIFTVLLAYLGQIKLPSTQKESGSGKTFDISRVRGFNLGRRLMESSFDFFLILFAAFWADVATGSEFTDLIVRGLPLLLAITFFYLFVLGIYRFLWRYIGLPEMVRILLASALSGLTTFAAFQLVYPEHPITSQYFLGFFVFLFALLAATRVSFRLIGMVFRRANQNDSARVLIFGAGDAGALVLRECQGNNSLGFQVAGFVDDDPGKTGRIIHGISVLGNTEHLAELIKTHRVKGVLIATGKPLESDKLELILEQARAQGAWVRKFSLTFEQL